MTVYKSTRTRTLGCDQHSCCIWDCQTVWYSRHSVKSIAPEQTVRGELRSRATTFLAAIALWTGRFCWYVWHTQCRKV